MRTWDLDLFKALDYIDIKDRIWIHMRAQHIYPNYHLLHIPCSIYCYFVCKVFTVDGGSECAHVASIICLKYSIILINRQIQVSNSLKSPSSLNMCAACSELPSAKYTGFPVYYELYQPTMADKNCKIQAWLTNGTKKYHIID